MNGIHFPHGFWGVAAWRRPGGSWWVLTQQDDRQAHSTHPRGGARWPLVEAQADEVVGERPEGPCADRTRSQIPHNRLRLHRRNPLPHHPHSRPPLHSLQARLKSLRTSPNSKSSLNSVTRGSSRPRTSRRRNVSYLVCSSQRVGKRHFRQMPQTNGVACPRRSPA